VASGNEQQGNNVWLTENVAFSPRATDLDTRLGSFKVFASVIRLV
jgi:hypothetical protein